MPDTPPDALAALTPVVEVLEQLGVRYHVGGSLASSAYGVPRATADVDLVAELQPEHVAPFVQRIESRYYVNPDAALDAVRRHGSFNLVHLNSMVKVDVFVPEERPFDREELRRARPDRLDPDVGARTFFVKSPEDLVLRKLEWFRAGHGTSSQQWSDVVGVLRVQMGQLDTTYLARWARDLDLSDLLERALAEASEG